MKNTNLKRSKKTMAARATAAVLALGLLAGCAQGGTVTTAADPGAGQTTTAQGTAPVTTEPGATTETTEPGQTVADTSSETDKLIFAADARQMVLDRLGNGFIEEIEYEHETNNPHYEGEALIDGTEVEFELNARTGEFTEWKEESSSDYAKYAPHLESMITMDAAADLVIERSGIATTFVQEIDLSFDEMDDTILEYEGDAYHDGVKYEFEINALTGEFTEWEEENSNDWAEKYSNLQ